MLHVVLYEPEIPPNTGNVIRLCANTGAHLHLIEPLGFDLDAASVRRAGLDYHELADLRVWPAFDACLAAIGSPRWFAVTKRGPVQYDEADYQSGDVLVFGPESRGLPEPLLERCSADRTIRLPMVPGNRSLNLSNAVAVVVYEAWRRLGFAGSIRRSLP